MVLLSGGGEVVALDAESGQKVWAQRISKMRLLGAGNDGDITALTLGVDKGGSVLWGDGARRRDVQPIRDRRRTWRSGGRRKYRLRSVGQPIRERSRFALPETDEDASSCARKPVAPGVEGRAYFGEVGIFRFDERIRLASKIGRPMSGLPHASCPADPSHESRSRRRPGGGGHAGSHSYVREARRWIGAVARRRSDGGHLLSSGLRSRRQERWHPLGAPPPGRHLGR